MVQLLHVMHQEAVAVELVAVQVQRAGGAGAASGPAAGGAGASFRSSN